MPFSLFSCVVCQDFLPCQKCQIKSLKKENNDLKTQLQYYKRTPHSLLLDATKSKYLFMDVGDYGSPPHFRDSTEFKGFPDYIYYNPNKFKFLTITFDPSKFGLFNPEESEKDYILYVLFQLFQKYHIYTDIIGCFEYQKNGSIHAHAILKTHLSTVEMDDYLRSHFTDIDKKKKQYAVKTERIKNYDNVVNYLQKESNHYFQHFSVPHSRESQEFPDKKAECIKNINSMETPYILRSYRKYKSLVAVTQKELTAYTNRMNADYKTILKSPELSDYLFSNTFNKVEGRNCDLGRDARGEGAAASTQSSVLEENASHTAGKGGGPHHPKGSNILQLF